MYYFDFSVGSELNSIFVNISLQLLGVSVLGTVLHVMFRKKSAVLRSGMCMAIFTSMICVAGLSVSFYKAKVAWIQPSVFRISTDSVISQSAPQKKKISEDNIVSAKAPASPVPHIENKILETTPGETHFINIWSVLESAWLVGWLFMLLKLGYGIAVVRGFRIGLKPIESERFNSLSQVVSRQFGQRRVAQLYSSSGVESPVTVGLIHPAVIIPEKLLATLTDDEVKSILLHELAHVYNYDHITGIFKRIIVAANWWNPLVFYISAKHACAREEIADNHVTQELSPRVYSHCLATLAEKICLISSLPMATGMAGSHSNLKQRIREILSSNRKTVRTGKLFKLVVASLCIVLSLVTAGLQAQSGKLTTMVESSVSSKSCIEAAGKRMKQDSLIYSSDDLKEIENIYQKINRKWNKKTAKASLDVLMTKYPQANRTGCALLYYAQMSRGKDQKKLLEKAIKDYGDCFYGDGVQVGALARYYLVLFYLRNKNIEKAYEIFKEFKSKYSNAINHTGRNLVSKLNPTIQKNRAMLSERKDAEKYTRASQREINRLSFLAIKRYKTKHGQKCLELLLEKYPGANKTGITLGYLAEHTRGAIQIKYLKLAISDYSNTFFRDGVQVGPYASLILAQIYLQKRKIAQARKLFDNIIRKYPDAIDHNGYSLSSLVKILRDGEPVRGYWNKYKAYISLKSLKNISGITRKQRTFYSSLSWNLSKKVYLFKVVPDNGFNPVTPDQFLAELKKIQPGKSAQNLDSIGPISVFRTKAANNRLSGSFFTDIPKEWVAAIEKDPSLKFVSWATTSTNKLLEQISSKQEYLQSELKATGPKVVRTFPVNGATGVNPNITHVIVTFDCPMRNRSWSFCRLDRKSQLPIIGKPFYDKSRTVIKLPVKLQPNHEYVTSLNLGSRYRGFRSAEGIPLYPYRLSFKTGPAK